ncbi:uncharacterized protein TA12115 [Theileria annulata]|uniref:Uncharacterized protein n=1 Tax=Theileria annulata TaxID=5874 RepID=Q4UDV0_THEAN|nr:uncharacterized protein TA12115 [Theileria annulata]CAI74739.1 hypothetical protein TA12115 [Theileria annulata]|eukprot:XP_952471.1 hypothetical protein TA12115 [Theileria annulata]
MFLKFLFIPFMYIIYVNSFIKNWNHLHKLPSLRNYILVKKTLFNRETDPSNNNFPFLKYNLDNDLINTSSALNYAIDQLDSREQLFDLHTTLFKDSQSLKHLNVGLTLFINDVFEAYSLYFFELLPSLYLGKELRNHLEVFLDQFQEKLIELFKISTFSIIEASPRSKVAVILNSIELRLILEKVKQLCKLFNTEYKFGKLELEIESMNDERLKNIALWSVVHSEAFKKGLVILSKALLMATLNNLFVPLFINFICKIIPPGFPGQLLIQYLFKSLKVSFV